MDPVSIYVGRQHSEKLRNQKIDHYTSIIEDNEPSLDTLVTMLAKLCNVPFAGISVVDEEMVWIKASYGIDATCLPREGAFCAAAIDSNQDLFIVENTTTDERFCKNSLVTDAPDIRFYAASPFLDEQDFAIGTLWIMDTSPRKPNEELSIILRSLAAFVVLTLEHHFKSEVTHLPNRSCFVRKLQALINNTSREVFVCSVNIQRLRYINNVFGKDATDYVLQVTGERLSKWSKTELIGDLGSGQFAFGIAMEGNDLCKYDFGSLLTELCQPITISGTTIAVTAIAGVATTFDKSASAAALVDMAELAANENPSIGVSKVNYFTTECDELTQNKISQDLVAALHNVDPNNALTPYYQPQVNMKTGLISGFEALLRWDCKAHRNVSIAQIFAVFDAMGVTPNVDLLIFEKVCADIAAWKAEGLTTKTISTNISRTTLQMPNLSDELLARLNQHALTTSDIYLEVTECGFQIDDHDTANYISSLQGAGFKIAIDDFGTGMSNIATLKDTDCHLLKIDRQFVHGISINPHIAALLRLIKGTADALNLKLLCEGVETQDDLDWLVNEGVYLIQGWYFSKAIHKNAVTTILKMPTSNQPNINIGLTKNLLRNVDKNLIR
ncbi:sensor domain-containing diguanylate cyclase [Vibrio atypicus]|uniref:sensor domain-containing diguanylate cyclase n=1 Tax=Vibrio atypicus TaxID=558271 RepID=UPI00135750E1|nr:sensor domain-containing phosphodiesterase [Vibrio atypicus]